MLSVFGFRLTERRSQRLSALAVLVLISPQSAAAQAWSYITVIPASTPPPSSLFTAYSGTCKEADGSPSGDSDVPDGGFIKTNTTLRARCEINGSD